VLVMAGRHPGFLRLPTAVPGHLVVVAVSGGEGSGRRRGTDRGL